MLALVLNVVCVAGLQATCMDNIEVGFQTPLQSAERSIGSKRISENFSTFSQPYKFYFEHH